MSSDCSSASSVVRSATLIRSPVDATALHAAGGHLGEDVRTREGGALLGDHVGGDRTDLAEHRISEVVRTRQRQIVAIFEGRHPRWPGPVEPLPGAIGIDIDFRLSRARNWSTVWKPAIDSLGPLLGEPNSSRPFTPNDDRIVRLGFHRSLNAALGWYIVLSVWWTAVSEE